MQNITDYIKNLGYSIEDRKYRFTETPPSKAGFIPYLRIKPYLFSGILLDSSESDESDSLQLFIINSNDINEVFLAEWFSSSGWEIFYSDNYSNSSAMPLPLFGIHREGKAVIHFDIGSNGDEYSNWKVEFGDIFLDYKKIIDKI